MKKYNWKGERRPFSREGDGVWSLDHPFCFFSFFFSRWFFFLLFLLLLCFPLFTPFTLLAKEDQTPSFLFLSLHTSFRWCDAHTNFAVAHTNALEVPNSRVELVLYHRETEHLNTGTRKRTRSQQNKRERRRRIVSSP
jgi:hypothetical protein